MSLRHRRLLLACALLPAMVCKKCALLFFSFSFSLAVLPAAPCPADTDALLIAGEKKLSKVAVPDKWKEGARNTAGTLSHL